MELKSREISLYCAISHTPPRKRLA